MEAVGQAEGSLHFSGFGDLNCFTSQSGTSYTLHEDLGFAVIVTTLCLLVEGFFSGQSLSLQECGLMVLMVRNGNGSVPCPSSQPGARLGMCSGKRGRLRAQLMRTLS